MLLVCTGMMGRPKLTYAEFRSRANERKRRLLAQETPEAKEKRLAKQREYKRNKRAMKKAAAAEQKPKKKPKRLIIVASLAEGRK